MANKNQNYLHPTLFNLLQFHADSIMLAFNVHHFGTITAFNPANQTASCTVDYSKVSYVYNAKSGNNDIVYSKYPPIVNAPVRFSHSMANGGFTYPVGIGDRCEIEFNDRDMDLWTMGQASQPNQTPAAPPSARLHQFSDAVIIAGINPPASPIQNFDSERPMMRNAAGTAFVALNPSNGKTQIQNPNGNLATILQSLISILEGLQVNTLTGNVLPTTIADLENVATQLSEVLE